jgi:hypothetical protein
VLPPEPKSTKNIIVQIVYLMNLLGGGWPGSTCCCTCASREGDFLRSCLHRLCIATKPRRFPHGQPGKWTVSLQRQSSLWTEQARHLCKSTAVIRWGLNRIGHFNNIGDGVPMGGCSVKVIVIHHKASEFQVFRMAKLGCLVEKQWE